MKHFLALSTAALLVLSWVALSGTRAEPTGRSGPPSAEPASAGVPADDRALLDSYEREQSLLRQQVIDRRRLHREGKISEAEVREAEQALIASLRRVYEARGAVLRREVALTGARDDLLPPPPSLTPASRSRPGAPAFRFSGTRWSVSDAAAVREFYAQRFGRSLPVTAYGQTPTHRQMRFDHRNAIDVAVHPDSPEGKALTEYLRRSGIPHVAFRGRVAGASTGAHIHIGPPSQRRAAD